MSNRPEPSKPRRIVPRGFTLIEVMITVAIISILAAVAYPSYQDSVRKGKRAQGRTALTELLQAQERWFTQRNTYALITPEGNTSEPAFKTYSGDNGAAPAYLLRAELCDGGLTITECVKLLAVPQFSDPEVGKLELWSTGKKTCDAGGGRVCWP